MHKSTKWTEIAYYLFNR